MEGQEVCLRHSFYWDLAGPSEEERHPGDAKGVGGGGGDVPEDVMSLQFFCQLP